MSDCRVRDFHWIVVNALCCQAVSLLFSRSHISNGKRMSKLILSTSHMSQVREQCGYERERVRAAVCACVRGGARSVCLCCRVCLCPSFSRMGIKLLPVSSEAVRGRTPRTYTAVHCRHKLPRLGEEDGGKWWLSEESLRVLYTSVRARRTQLRPTWVRETCLELGLHPFE